MVKAKLVMPEQWHYCTNCKNVMRGPARHFDGWLAQSGWEIGSVMEYPTQEDADNAIPEEERPAKRVNKIECANECEEGETEPREVWKCGYCDTQYTDRMPKAMEDAGDCCG